ncbi:MAG: selenocysteine-specific translation elongation factor [Candidatus Krumholzibacteriota bacterium]|nr:selenocysteine-specific translation elongation factor [Candidatus Krumholzibacteriota bacterium]
MNVIIGTAGHVDHGKTEIVRALTGWETDRLAEEKARGISIVLGFAPVDLGEGVAAGIVDVPGHERFVKNMVSGAVGVDVALMVVAADEGVMPQTEEHFEVLRLLGIEAGVVAVTKIDLVDDETAEIVESEIRDLLAGTPLAGSPIVQTSAVTKAGVEELRLLLRVAVAGKGERRGGDFFRLPVDRIFTRSGIGTIVTGTAWSGEVHKGDELVVEPAGRPVRVREVQSFDRVMDGAQSGMRTALALHGVRVGDVEIGDQVVFPGVLERTSMIDAVVEVGRLAGSALVNRQRVRFHHAAGETLARAVILDRDELEAGSRGFVQFRLERPTLAMGGDGFVLRSYSPMRVVAGGRVVDPAPQKAKRFRPETIRTLEALLAGGDDAIVALAAARGTGGLPSGVLRRFGWTAAEASAALGRLAEHGKLRRIGDLFFDAAVVEETARSMTAIAREFHARNRLSWGIDREELREKTRLAGNPLFDLLVERGVSAGVLYLRDGAVRAGSVDRELSAEDRRILEALARRIAESGFRFPSAGELAGEAGGAKRLAGYLAILAERGDAVRIGRDGWLDAAERDRLIGLLRERFAAGGTIAIGDIKEAFGVSRKYAVPLLEHLDANGYTKRTGDVRVAGERLSADAETKG